MDIRAHLIPLAEAWATHDGVTHWAISMRLMRKGDFFARLKRGHTCRVSTARRVLQKISALWPADLPWPTDIPRPAPTTEAAR